MSTPNLRLRLYIASPVWSSTSPGPANRSRNIPRSSHYPEIMCSPFSSPSTDTYPFSFLHLFMTNAVRASALADRGPPASLHAPTPIELIRAVDRSLDRSEQGPFPCRGMLVLFRPAEVGFQFVLVEPIIFIAVALAPSLALPFETLRELERASGMA